MLNWLGQKKLYFTNNEGLQQINKLKNYVSLIYSNMSFIMSTKFILITSLIQYISLQAFVSKIQKHKF